MKQRYSRRKETEFVDSDFAEALYGNKSENSSSSRQAQRKAQQFCRQVQRALNLALAESSSDESLASLFVEGVSPAPDCGRLLVHVLVPTGYAIAEAIGTLRRNAPRLRSEVAMAITRKRAPELMFVPAIVEGGSDE
ncbi:MAG: ribosome-binding factor A [Terriglobia bacterium]